MKLRKVDLDQVLGALVLRNPVQLKLVELAVNKAKVHLVVGVGVIALIGVVSLFFLVILTNNFKH